MLEGIDDGASTKQVVYRAEGGESRRCRSHRAGDEIGPRGGDMGAAIIGQNQCQV